MADIGGVRFIIEGAAEKVQKAISDSLKAFDQLQAKIIQVNRTAVQTEQSNHRIIKTLGAAGIGGALLYAARANDTFRKATDGAFKAGVSFFAALSKGGGIFNSLLAIGKGFGHFLVGLTESFHLSELGAFGLFNKIRELVKGFGALGLVFSAIGSAFGSLVGPIGTAASVLGGFGSIMLGIIGLAGRLSEALGERLVESGRRAKEVNKQYLEVFTETERVLFGLTVAVKAYNEATGENEQAEKFIGLTTKIATVTGLARQEIAQGALVLLDYARITHLTSDQIAELLERSADFAQSAHQDFLTVVRGIDNAFRGYTQTLQSVGLAIGETEISNSEFARSLGKTSDQLSKTERSTAFFETFLEKTSAFANQSARALGETYFGALIKVRTAQLNIASAIGEGVAASDKWLESLKGATLQIIATHTTLLYFYGLFSEVSSTFKIGIGIVLEYSGKVLFLVAALSALRKALLVMAAAEGVSSAALTTFAAGISAVRLVVIGLVTTLGAWAAILGAIVYLISTVPEPIRKLVSWLYKHTIGAREAAAATGEVSDAQKDFNKILEEPLEGKVYQKLLQAHKDETDALKLQAYAYLSNESSIEALKQKQKDFTAILNEGGHIAGYQADQLEKARLEQEVWREALEGAGKGLLDNIKALKVHQAELKSGAYAVERFALDERQAKLQSALMAAEILGDRDAVKVLRLELDLLQKADYANFFRKIAKDARDAARDLHDFTRGIREANQKAAIDRIAFKGTETARAEAEFRSKIKDIENQEYDLNTEINKKLEEKNKLLEAGAAQGRALNANDLAKLQHEIHSLQNEQQRNHLSAESQKRQATALYLEKLAAVQADKNLEGAQRAKELEAARLDALQKIAQAKLSEAKTDTERDALQRQVAGFDQQRIQNEINYTNTQLKELRQQKAINEQETQHITGIKRTNTELDKRIADLETTLKIQQQNLIAAGATAKIQQNSAEKLERIQQRTLEDVKVEYEIKQELIDLEIQNLQLGLEEEDSITKRQQIQIDIINKQREAHRLRIQQLQEEVQLNEDLLAKEGGKNTELQQTINNDKKRVELLQKQDEIYDRQIQHVKELGQEVTEVGRGLEESISDFIVELPFKKSKDNFKDLWSSFEDLGKLALKNTIKNKLNFEGIISKNIFQDAGGLMDIFTGATTGIEGLFSNMFTSIIGLAKNAFGILGDIIGSFISVLFGNGSGGGGVISGIFNALGSASGGSGRSGGGIIGGVLEIAGAIGGKLFGSSGLFSGVGKVFSDLTKSLGGFIDLAKGAFSLFSVYSGIRGLFGGKNTNT